MPTKRRTYLPHYPLIWILQRMCKIMTCFYICDGPFYHWFCCSAYVTKEMIKGRFRTTAPLASTEKKNYPTGFEKEQLLFDLYLHKYTRVRVCKRVKCFCAWTSFSRYDVINVWNLWGRKIKYIAKGFQMELITSCIKYCICLKQYPINKNLILRIATLLQSRLGSK
jgi:hypothetical protein